MQIRQILTLGLGTLALASPAFADEVITATLTASNAGGVRAMSPRKIKLSEQKPATLTREPVYRYTPRYGVVTLGDAKNNQIAVVLDAPEGKGTVRLLVDSNGNGDLTDEQTLIMTVANPTNANATRPAAQNGVEGDRLVVSAPVIARYSIPGRAGMIESKLQFIWWGGELTANREYNREGKLTLGGRTYRIGLIDQEVNARFDGFKHDEDEPARVVLLVDRNEDGEYDLRKEAYDASKPFRLGTGYYEISSIDARGTTLALKKTSKEAVSAASLKVGSTIIDFESKLFNYTKSVAFPNDKALKGKVVLLDFWAMWCPPCIEELPNIVRTYNEYRDRGFEILGVSLDHPKKEGELKAFLQQNNMPWPQIYDGGYWKAEIAELFDINAIPNAFLVDADTGKILAMGDDLRGEGLAKAVEAALTKKRR